MNATDFGPTLAVLRGVPQLPDSKLIACVDLLEQVSEIDEVARLMEDIRPRLRQLKPRRHPTLKRLMCRPLEDLLVSGEAPVPGLHIPRSTVASCWQLVQQRDGELLRQLRSQLAKLSKEGDRGAMLVLARNLWQRAAQATTAAVAAGNASPALLQMSRIFVVAEEIEAFKRAVPAKPLARFRESNAATGCLAAALKALERRGVPGDGLAMTVAARLDSPGELIAWLRAGEISLASETLGLLGGQVMQEAALMAGRLAARDVLAPEDAARDAARLLRWIADGRVALPPSLQSEFELQAFTAVETVKEALHRHVLDPARSVVAKACPALGEAPEKEVALAAESQARALGRARRLAPQLGLQAKIGSVIDGLRDSLNRRIDSLLIHCGAVPERRPAFEADMFRSLRLIELIAGPEEAERLWSTMRQGMAAR